MKALSPSRPGRLVNYARSNLRLFQKKLGFGEQRSSLQGERIWALPPRGSLLESFGLKSAAEYLNQQLILANPNLARASAASVPPPAPAQEPSRFV
jgi:hypothetical protein